jgi:hypothetical protein
MTDAKKDELSELKARVAELERAAAPPKPYIDDWVPPPHPIDRVSMHPSTMREFAEAVPTSLVRDVVADNRAPQGPSSQGAVPSSQQVSNVRTGGGGNRTGWQNPIPLSPPPGIGLVDRIARLDSARQEGELMVAAARRKVAEEK